MNPLKKREITLSLKQEAKKLGFDFCGVAKSEFLKSEESHLENWLKNGFHGEMTYMENHFDLRLDPGKLVENAKSVVSLTYNYFTEKEMQADSFQISKYAFGEDYHHIIKEKLFRLINFLKQDLGHINIRAFVDSAPILERVWAEKAGLGWIGKNTLLINKNRGSFYFLAELVLDVELEYDPPFKTDHCGTCTKCIDACPTEAILPGKVLDGSKCISYFTIELKEEIPTSMKGKLNDWIFGCDICQDVCPWNRFSKPHREMAFQPHPDLLEMTKKDWIELEETTFQKVFKKSAVKRTKFNGLKRNIDFVQNQ
ncbi:tRNA epoxyqueuosine(34) reductase QueG [Namhaeicola litoreus]|uniref:Epoxyqueuosine reductase n=1 Tax=Namhaeicola litoreus TaxID=1052145 RepID=A0ABW3XY66_9FLAO